MARGQVCAGGVRCASDTPQQVHLPSPTNDLIMGACNAEGWGRSLQAACHEASALVPKDVELACGSQGCRIKRLRFATAVSVSRPPGFWEADPGQPSRGTAGHKEPGRACPECACAASAQAEAVAPGLTRSAASSTALAPAPSFPSPAALPTGGPRPESEGTSSGSLLRCACAWAPRCAAPGPGPTPSPSPRLPDAGVTSPRRAAAITESRVPS